MTFANHSCCPQSLVLQSQKVTVAVAHSAWPWEFNDLILLIVTQVNCLDFKIFIFPSFLLSLPSPSLPPPSLPPLCVTAQVDNLRRLLSPSII